MRLRKLVSLLGAVVHDPFPIAGAFDDIAYFQKLVPLSDAERELHALRERASIPAA